MDLDNLVRIGTVTDIDNNKRLARVKYQDTGITSDWLYVVAARPYIPSYDGPQRTEYEAGGSLAEAYASHKHDLDIKPWMPKLDSVVLCLYLPGSDDGDGLPLFNADGFVLGELGPLDDIKQ